MSPHEQLKAVYKDSKTWAAKVNKMTEAQIIAILIRFKAEGKIK
jgi:hypothetical protein